MKSQIESGLQPEKLEGGESLPELELKELSRGSQRIEKEKVNFIEAWKNYTLIGSQDHQLSVYDETGKELKIPTVFEVNWPRITTKAGGSYLTTATSSRDDISIGTLPVGLKILARELFKNKQDRYLNVGNMGTGKYEIDPTRLEFIDKGKYLILPDPQKGQFFALQVENEGGIAQAPKSWKDVSCEKFSPEDAKTIEQMLVRRENIRALNQEYSAFTTDVGINILRNSELDGTTKPVFEDDVPLAGENVTVDPGNPNIVYYARGSNPDKIYKLDISSDPSGWKKEEAVLPKRYNSVNNLQLDPQGKVFLFYSQNDLVMLDRDSLEEVKSLPGFSHVKFDEQGRIRALDKDGYVVVLEPDFNSLNVALERRRMDKVLKGLPVVDVFNQAEKKKEPPASKSRESLQPLRAQYEEQFRTKAESVNSQDGVELLRQGFEILRATLVGQPLRPDERDFILEGALAILESKEHEVAGKTARETLDAAKQVMTSGLSLSTISDARTYLDKLKVIEPRLDDATREEIRNFGAEVDQKSKEIFRQKSDEIVKDVEGLLKGVQGQLEGFTRKSDFDDWQEFRFPQLNARLAGLLRDCPLEAEEAYKTITKARNDLRSLATTFEEKFKREYAQVREKATERIEALIDTIHHDIDALIERARTKGFRVRKDAEQYLDASEARKSTEAEIKAIENDNPDASRELDRSLKAKISAYLSEVERGGRVNVAETGQQMVLFGDVQFPKWEAKVKQKQERQVEVLFEANKATQGPGVGPDQVYGDIALAIRTSHGEKDRVGLYEGLENEDEWRLGLLSYRGKEISPSYVNGGEYREFRKDYIDWSRGESSALHQEFEAKRAKLQEIYAKRGKIGDREEAADEVWKAEYRTALDDYAKFYADHHVALLRRIDEVKAKPETEFKNGKGFVPEWQAHWTQDAHTEQNLEDMATLFKMQLDLQEGLLDLKGHAGTGKDVLMKMFASMTNRPYFVFDCTKWTTEYELSEDVILESKEGASQTVKVPSTILNGITNPGAIVYLNEMNAMPEQAQIFLHSLMDEKRAITLKTSSGRVVRAHPSVLLAGSMNPNYPGTFEPQFATRSRMVSLEIGYPPLRREKDPGDRNPEAPYDASEALRVARELDSLNDLTYEANMDRNGFVKMWDKYVNNINNDAPEPTPVQRYDIEVTLALIQFANRLREDFIKVFEKSRTARKALPVTQPITGRELRRCAYALNKIPADQKANLAGAEGVAKELLAQFYLSHFDKKEDKDEIQTALATWTSKRRVTA